MWKKGNEIIERVKLVKSIYRKALRVITRFEPEQREVYYNYTRLKLNENWDNKRSQIKIKEAEEEILWLKKILDNKK
jgi:hypothetical protein